MSNPTTLPCTVQWCASDTHPAYRDRISHRALFGTFAGGVVQIVLSWTEFTERPSMGPTLRMSRADASTVSDSVDLIPGEARLLAELFGLLDASEVLQFALAFRRGAEALEEAMLDVDEREGLR